MKSTAEEEEEVQVQLVDIDNPRAERDHNAKTNDAGSAQKAISKSRGNRAGASSNTNTTTQKSTGNSYTTIIDIFVALMQKIGIWMYNIFPHLNVAIPIFTISMSWLQVPAIGWDLALSLPDLERHGWLYWCVILCGLAFPLYIGYVIFTDNGVFHIGSDSTAVAESAGPIFRGGLCCCFSSESKVLNEGEDVEKEYTDQVKLNAIRVFSRSFLLSVISILVGYLIDDGQTVGLGILILLFGFLYFGWAHFKLYIFEIELTKFNRSIVHAYRSMRVFVCSTVLLLLLRSIYIMTISALCWMIVDSSSNNDRTFEFYVACILIGPISFSFPFAVYHYGVLFISKYVDHLQETELSKENFRGWLERFPQREINASMHEVTISVILLPFDSHFWYFAWLQLFERAVATILVTCLYRDINAQLFAILSIEVLAGAFEYWKMPFLDPEEDKYNLIWRSIAFLILLITLLLKFVGEAFAIVGDISLLLLTFAAICLFVKALDPPRIYQIYRLNAAVKKFRKTKDDDQGPDILDKLGTFAEIPKDLDVVRLLQSAFKQLPNDISCSAVIRDALNYTQQYRLLLQANNDAILGDFIISNNMFGDVGPLLSLGGSRIIQSVPSLISAYTNVTRIILSDMNLNDDCSVKALASLDNLVFLNLDDNLFERKIEGLEFLVKVQKLSIRNLRKWQGDSINDLVVGLDCMAILAKDLQAMVALKELDMEGSRFTSGSVSIEFAMFLQQIGRCTTINGNYMDANFIKEHIDDDNIFKTGFSVAQFRQSGASTDQLRQGKLIENHRTYLSVSEMTSLGYPLFDAYNSLKVVKTFSTFREEYKAACFNTDGSLLICVIHETFVMLEQRIDHNYDQVRVYDVESGRCIFKFSAECDTCGSICIANDGHHMVGGYRSISYYDTSVTYNGVKIWNLDTGACVLTCYGHDDQVTCVCISPTKRHVVSGSRDKTVKVFDMDSGVCLSTFTGHELSVTCVCVSPNGRWVVSGAKDYNIKVWDVESGTLVSTLTGHISHLNSVCVSQDSRRIVSACGYKDNRYSLNLTIRKKNINTVNVWDMESGALMYTFYAFDYRDNINFHSACLSADGLVVFSAADNGVLKVHDMRVIELKNIIEIPNSCLTTIQANIKLETKVFVSANGTRIATVSKNAINLLG